MSGSVDSEAFRLRSREREAQDLAVWIFLVSEAFIFGAFLLVYLVMRWRYADGFSHAGAETSILLGTVNTAVLLTSSLTMALADIRAEEGRGGVRFLLVATALLGAAFLGVKFYEWYDEFQKGLMPFLGLKFTYDGPERHAAILFFRLYYALTGLHALHLVLAVAMVAGAALRWSRIAPEKRGQRVAAFALYWHFVDVIWVFLYPFLYLLGRAS